MSVSRSALASRAARSASAGVGLQRRARSRRRSSCIALRRARAGCRACCGRRPCASCGTRDSSAVLRSWSKKNRASARRGRTTRSLPPTMWRGSATRMLRHDQELRLQLALRRRAAGSTSGSAASSGSGTPAAPRGTRRRSCPRKTLGHSTSAVTSSSSARIRRVRRLRARRLRCSWRSISARRAAKSAITLPSAAQRASRSRPRIRALIVAAPRKRWPCVVRPAARPSTLPGTTSLAVQQRPGRAPAARTALSPCAPAHHLRDRQRLAAPPRQRVRRTSASAAPLALTRATNDLALGASCAARAGSTATPCLARERPRRLAAGGLGRRPG